MNYRREIDGLRALAVLPVILFHAGFETFGGGFVGVDVFFVISGYLITSIILAERDAGRFTFLEFYERRARRILPALFLVMLVCVPFAWLWLVPSDMKDFSQSLVAVSVFLSNILFWGEVGYFDTDAELKPLLHTWSLAVEEQYYLLFPPFLLAAWRFAKGYIVLLLVVVALASLAVAQWRVFDYPAATFFLLPTRGWELLIGAFIAFYHRSCKTSASQLVLSNRLCQAGGAVGLAMIAIAVLAFNKSTPVPSLYALLPTVGAALVILCAYPQTVVGKLLGSRMFLSVGLISYSAYLWHYPLFAFARHKRLTELNVAMMVTLSAATLGLAYLSWRYVETVFRRRDLICRSTIFALSFAISLCFITVGLIGHFTAGFARWKTTEEQRAVLATAVPSPKRAECHTAGADYRRAQNACEYIDGKLNWAVLGDSHTVELAWSLARLLQARGESLKQFSFSSCRPAYGSRGDECAAWTNEAVDFILTNDAIKNVVISYRIQYHLWGGHENIYPNLPNKVNEQDREVIWNAYKNVLAKFANAGKRVFLVLQAPEVRHRVETLVVRANELENIYGVERVWWDRRSEYLKGRLSEIDESVIVVDPAVIFCDEKLCYAVKDRVALYFDTHHMSIYGAEFVAAEILKKTYPDPES